MPLVVVKVLSGYRYETPAELAAYSAIESDDATVDVSAFASMLSHGQFEYEWNTIDYFVLDYLGPTLLDVMQRSCYSRFTGKMTMAVAIQLLRRHRDTHSVHLIHNGAKPANYCLPPNPGTVDDDIVNTKIYMIDFGFSTFFTPPSEGGSPYDVCGFSGGNPCFRSTGCDAGDSVSPRDDLEGLAYTLAYLGKGSLPWWRGPNGHWYSEEYRCKYDEKADAGVNVIFGGMDPIYTWFFELVKGMSWGEMPDYDALIQKFCERWIEKGYGSAPGEYDWWIKSTKKENVRHEYLWRRWCFTGWEVFFPGPTDDYDEYEPPLPKPAGVELPSVDDEELLFFDPERKALPEPDEDELLFFRRGMDPIHLPLPDISPEETEFFHHQLFDASVFSLVLKLPRVLRSPTLEGMAEFFLQAENLNPDHCETFDATEVSLPLPDWNELEMFKGQMSANDVALPSVSDEEKEELELALLPKYYDSEIIQRELETALWIPLPRPDFDEYCWFFVRRRRRRW
ncbi:hypothetical protein SISNIDRAFT_482998 [Sistotremastrum niveocremeum HHB9708]|uniref:Protein kinase domain-containing protein n=1 Tax=Sistotremastrum niveocremeum HHB9708 TaxID=1314777 RepID=A0A164XZE3_9AGAM|nr:hypothetical protein SISNIDRAFT_482998 [Sistotremastrum niveocremeum HHB9708]